MPARRLFRARIHPARPANGLLPKEIKVLAASIPPVLEEAIASGGSTIRDFASNGEGGYFQHHFDVYGRTGKPCRRCATPIAKLVQAGRATFFCPQCQKAARQKP